MPVVNTRAELFRLEKALIVDADPDTRSLYRTVLEPFTDVIVEAEDGAEALGKALSERPALVITEMRLPRVDGLELCSLLRRDAATATVKLVVITSTPYTSGQAAPSVDAVLMKPCFPHTLINALKEIFEPDGAAARALREPVSFDEAVQRRKARSHTYPRGWTTFPPTVAPVLFCPVCSGRLLYQNSYMGGVTEKAPEQWDYLSCSRCGRFRYRHRTRKLTRFHE